MITMQQQYYFFAPTVGFVGQKNNNRRQTAGKRSFRNIATWIFFTAYSNLSWWQLITPLLLIINYVEPLSL